MTLTRLIVAVVVHNDGGCQTVYGSFPDWDTAREFAAAMREQGYKVALEETTDWRPFMEGRAARPDLLEQFKVKPL